MKKNVTKAATLAKADNKKPAVKVIKPKKEEPAPVVAKAKPLSFGPPKAAKSSAEMNQAYDVRLINAMEAERKRLLSD